MAIKREQKEQKIQAHFAAICDCLLCLQLSCPGVLLACINFVWISQNTLAKTRMFVNKAEISTAVNVHVVIETFALQTENKNK